MNIQNRLTPEEAARNFIDDYFPACNAAILAGSVVRGEATATSDLDIVIFDEKIPSPYRESLIAYEWPIEVFVHNFTSYQQYFKSDRERARPSLQRMVSEGVVLKHDDRVLEIKQKANQELDKGPEKWSSKTIEMKRYFITDTLDDFLGATNRAEEIFTANALADQIHEFVLRTNEQWIGSSKWVVRALKQFNEAFMNDYIEAFDAFYKTGNKTEVEELVDKVLQPYGGRLFSGFSIGK